MDQYNHFPMQIIVTVLKINSLGIILRIEKITYHPKRGFSRHPHLPSPCTHRHHHRRELLCTSYPFKIAVKISLIVDTDILVISSVLPIFFGSKIILSAGSTTHNIDLLDPYSNLLCQTQIPNISQHCCPRLNVVYCLRSIQYSHVLIELILSLPLHSISNVKIKKQQSFVTLTFGKFSMAYLVAV